MIVNKLSAVWISDIHFFRGYNDFSVNCVNDEVNCSNKLNTYLSKTIDKIISFYQKGTYIPYIIFSGDIAQEGSTDDYKLFWDKFLKNLLDNILDLNLPYYPLLLFVPGNHDVNQKQSKFVSTYVKNYIESIELKKLKKIEPKSDKIKALIAEKHEVIKERDIPTDRNKYFNDSRFHSQFKSLFKDYTDWIKEIANDSKYGNFIPKNSSTLKVSLSYQEEFLNGYIIDHKNQSIIVLINSSWFSIGKSFNELLVKEEFNEGEPNTPISKKEISNLRLEAIIDSKDKLVEFNSQITGLNKILTECKEIEKATSEYPDYFVSSIVHHPLNWINKFEYYIYKGFNDKEHLSKLKTLLNKSDLLLSGHEHVPNDMNSQVVFKNTIHYRAGQFLGDQIHIDSPRNQKLSNIYSYNWFSLLQIEPLPKFIKQHRFTYNKDDDTWNEIKPNLDILKKRKTPYKLKKNRLDKITNSFQQNRSNDSFLRYVENNVKSIVQPKILKITKTQSYNLYIVENFPPFSLDKQKSILYFVRDNNFYDKLTAKKSDFFDEVCNSIHANMNNGIQNVFFICTDIHTCSQAIKKYQSTKDNKTSRQAVLESLKLKADSDFDWFRFLFYDNLSSFPDDKIKSLNNMYFHNHIIPYWHYEKYFTNIGT